jgi:hypothetical protein
MKIPKCHKLATSQRDIKTDKKNGCPLTAD